VSASNEYVEKLIVWWDKTGLSKVRVEMNTKRSFQSGKADKNDSVSR